MDKNKHNTYKIIKYPDAIKHCVDLESKINNRLLKYLLHVDLNNFDNNTVVNYFTNNHYDGIIFNYINDICDVYKIDLFVKQAQNTQMTETEYYIQVDNMNLILMIKQLKLNYLTGIITDNYNIKYLKNRPILNILPHSFHDDDYSNDIDEIIELYIR